MAEEQVKRRRRGPGDFYVVVTDEGVSVLKSDALNAIRAGADVYELGRKVKSMTFKPGAVNLLTGDKEPDDIKVEYEEVK